MSVHVSSYVWKNCQATIAQKLVLLKLADNCNDDGYAFPSVATIARECCMSERYVQKIIKQLIASGELSVDVQSGKKTPNGYTNVYYMVKYRHVNNITATPSDLRVTGEQPDTPITDGVNNSTPLNSDGVNNSTPQGVNNSTPKPSVKPSLKETTSTPDGVQTTAETAEKKKEPVKQPITDVVKELETQFGIVSTGWQIAHIIQGSYKATKRKTSQTTVWVELTTRFAEEPATPEMVASFAKWYKQKTNGLSLKNTDTFLNHYAEWFKDHRQTVQKRNPVTVGKMQPAAPIETVTVDVEDMQALQKMIEEQRKKIKGEAA